ncbi:MAG TPA: NADH-quinone oxidoreductase subunit L, partial [Solibacterales bacterium]|nr:NADH-quinone oxidoreductase subunit L [Bryobacterales bacterium]
MSALLGLIVLLPLLGFLFNGVFATRLGGARLHSEPLVNFIACALPLGSFVLTAVALSQLLASGQPVIEATYTWAEIGGRKL